MLLLADDVIMSEPVSNNIGCCPCRRRCFSRSGNCLASSDADELFHGVTSTKMFQWLAVCHGSNTDIVSIFRSSTESNNKFYTVDVV